MCISIIPFYEMGVTRSLTPAQRRQLDSDVEAVYGPNAIRRPKPRRRRRVYYFLIF